MTRVQHITVGSRAVVSGKRITVTLVSLNGWLGAVTGPASLSPVSTRPPTVIKNGSEAQTSTTSPLQGIMS